MSAIDEVAKAAYETWADQFDEDDMFFELSLMDANRWRTVARAAVLAFADSATSRDPAPTHDRAVEREEEQAHG